MNTTNKDVGRVDQKVEIAGSNYMAPVKSKHIGGDAIKAGGDVMKGEGFNVNKTYGGPANPTEGGIYIKIVVNGRTKKIFLPAGKHTLKDLKKQVATDKCFANHEKAIYEFDDDDGELCDSQPLKNDNKLKVTFD